MDMTLQQNPYPSNADTDIITYPVEATDTDGVTRRLTFFAQCDEEGNVIVTEQTLDGTYIPEWAKSYGICEDGAIEGSEADVVFNGIQEFLAPSS